MPTPPAGVSDFRVLPLHYVTNWLRGLDLNQRFPAYETSEDDLTPLPHDKLGSLDSIRTNDRTINSRLLYH